MPALPDLDALWNPLRIGPMRVPNRVLTTGHALLYGEGGLISDRHIAYYQERARGGVGLIVTEQQAAHPSGRNYHASCVAFDERVVPRYAKLADAVHVHGARMMAQLFCGGAQGSGTMYIDHWRPLLAPSTIASTQFQELPAAMEQADIDDVVASFGRSARNVRDGGLDGIEIHAAHSQLLGAFLSPAWNKRTDAYGGSLANRCRIVSEIGEAVRKEVGDKLAVGLRLSVSEYLAGGAGIGVEETERQIERFVDSGLFDFYDLSAGGYYAKQVSVTPMLSDLPDAFLAPAARRLRAVCGNRGIIMVVGRIRTLAHAAQLVAEGAADMVALTRAHIADPHAVRKTREGKAEQVVPCVGANVCVRRLGENNHVACLMNPLTGREAAWRTLRPAARRGSLLVVGGGPCGMKAAALAAARGHRVWLAEAAPALGGHLRRLAALPGRRRWQDAIDSLAEPLGRAGVETMLDVEGSVELVRRLQPEIVVCATGAAFCRSGYSPTRPDRTGIPGADGPGVIDIGTAVDRVLADAGALGGRVLILDEGQDVLTAGLAELLGQGGAAVRIVTPHLYFGEALGRTYELPSVMKRFAALGVRVTPQMAVE
ncbi:MAG: NAD(P)-binding protein, partial [Acetobacteraceae bacterium]|nr:NAD(P)-binding protein [Acetobacteraceae bacterium]